MSMKSVLQRMFPTAWQPAIEPDGYQFDLDGSLRYNRFATGVDYFPFVGGDGVVPQIGAVSGIFPQMDVFIWQQMTGKIPFGPGSTTVPINLQYQITVPGLSKSL